MCASESTDPLTLNALRYLQTMAGKQLLADALQGGDSVTAQQALRAHYPADMCRAALALIAARARVRDKFEHPEDLLLDREGGEMATRAEVAHYRAWRMRSFDTILDLCCGVGGDMLHLGRSARVIGVDVSRRRLEMARHNCAAYGIDGARFIAADVRTLRPRADAALFDPARRGARGRRRSGAEYDPPLSYVETIRAHLPEVIVKVSPAIPEEELPNGCEVEFVSSGGQCREAALYFGALATAKRRATLLPERHTLTEDGLGPEQVGPVGAYVYDPDPAVVRAHLIDELARKLGAWKLDGQIAYLSSDTLRATPLARAYHVLEVLPFHVKKLRQHLRREGFFPQQIKRRRFPLEPVEVERKLGITSGDIPVVLILTRLEDKTACLICKTVAN